ncbi:MAG: hypothetical protein MI923_25470 [Phycisphaerales bacterium]|nr:hypothetical protein [Phycisphaerales bacterium]
MCADRSPPSGGWGITLTKQRRPAPFTSLRQRRSGLRPRVVAQRLPWEQTLILAAAFTPGGKSKNMRPAYGPFPAVVARSDSEECSEKARQRA